MALPRFNLASSSRESSAFAPITREIVVLAFQLDEFIQSGHAYGQSIDTATRDIITRLVQSNFRPPTSTRSNRRARSGSTDPLQVGHHRQSSEPPPSWPENWAVDHPQLRQVIRRFEQATQGLLHDSTTPLGDDVDGPPSTGTTPPTSRNSNRTNQMNQMNQTNQAGHTAEQPRTMAQPAFTDAQRMELTALIAQTVAETIRA